MPTAAGKTWYVSLCERSISISNYVLSKVLDLPGPTIKRQEQAQARATADSGPKAADRVDH